MSADDLCDEHLCGCSHDHEKVPFRNILLRTVVAGILVIVAIIIPFLVPEQPLFSLPFSLIALALTAGPIFREAYAGLRNGEQNVSELVSIALIGVIILGECTVAAEVSVILTIGELAESWAYARSKRDLENIVSSNPRYSHRIENNQNRGSAGQ